MPSPVSSARGRLSKRRSNYVLTASSPLSHRAGVWSEPYKDYRGIGEQELLVSATPANAAPSGTSVDHNAAPTLRLCSRCLSLSPNERTKYSGDGTGQEGLGRGCLVHYRRVIICPPYNTLPPWSVSRQPAGFPPSPYDRIASTRLWKALLQRHNPTCRPASSS